MGLNHAVVAVLGASGFVGNHVVEYLSQKTNIKTLATTRGSPTGSRCEWIKLDFAGENAISEFFEQYRPTHVINLVAHGTSPFSRELAASFQINVMAALNAFREASNHGCRRFLHIGTCEEYGRHQTTVDENSAVNPEGTYATSKLAGSLLLQQLAHSSETELIIARLFGTWGPGEAEHRLVPSIVAGFLRGEEVALSDGQQIRDFALVQDVAECIVDLLFVRESMDNHIINIGSGEQTSVRSFVEKVAGVLDYTDKLEFGSLARRPNEVEFVAPRTERLEQLLGRLPRAFSKEAVFAIRDTMIASMKAETATAGAKQ